MDSEYEKVMQNYHKLQGEIKSECGSENSQDSKKQIDIDLSTQMKRVSKPIFTSSKKEYEFCKAAFTACIRGLVKAFLA
jgi:hypothetical protein